MDLISINFNYHHKIQKWQHLKEVLINKSPLGNYAIRSYCSSIQNTCIRPRFIANNISNKHASIRFLLSNQIVTCINIDSCESNSFLCLRIHFLLILDNMSQHFPIFLYILCYFNHSYLYFKLVLYIKDFIVRIILKHLALFWM